MADIRWYLDGYRISYFQCGDDADDYRYSFRIANFENRTSIALSVWKRSRFEFRFERMPVAVYEYTVAALGRSCHIPFSSGLGRIVVYYDCRYSVRYAAFQVGGIVFDSVRKRDYR